MELIRGVHNLAERHHGCVASIGNYDGLHLGHRQVLRQLSEQAREDGLPSLVMCFEPTPLEFFCGDRAPARLSTFREKVEQLGAMGIDRFFCVRFDPELADMSPEQFVRDFLVEGIGVRHLVVGDDFRFGRDRSGDFSTLEVAGRTHGFEVVDTPSYSVDGIRVSSTLVRESLAKGDLGFAEQMLGRPYSMSGRVVRGDQLGRQLGFPTANLRVGRHKPPLRGVYAVRIRGLGQVRAGMASLGTRPTVDGTEMRLEVHIFDFDEDVYGRHIRVEFAHRLRTEKRFDNVGLMTEQLHRDGRTARRVLGV
ncbi:MAG: bifunctional riboflavin kinase/FAD synthetase [Chromatiales bacterium]|jgi:riboflavin kinase/FMN adenylyltransferase|nr:bifunctional riboflavin kinase/FAD synthetase [Chromatiales bacterium]MDH4030734.1 bifunctional riboflavin kinase/FAD synthetase [Chromatiales bacterium]